MDEEQAEQQSPAEGMSGRGQHFGEGMISGGEVSPGLQESARRFMSGVPRSYRGLGSANGMGATTAASTMNGMLTATQNGSAADTYNSKKWFRGN